MLPIRAGVMTRLRKVSSRVLDWLDHRIGVRTMIVPIFTHPIPKGLNWSYVLGSATLVAFLIQVLTGVALGMTYVPSTDAAYESIRFISPWSPVIVAMDPESPVPNEVVANLSGDALEGANVYVAQACWRCHAINGQGGIVGPSMTNVGVRLEPDDLVVTILAGRGNMPGYGRTIPPDQLNDLIAFLTTLRGHRPPAVARE